MKIAMMTLLIKLHIGNLLNEALAKKEIWYGGSINVVKKKKMLCLQFLQLFVLINNVHR